MATPPLCITRGYDATEEEIASLSARRADLDKLLDSTTHFRENVYRYLSNDACETRHNIIEPQMLQKGIPLDNTKDRAQRAREAKLEKPRSRGPFGCLPPELLEMILVDLLTLETLTMLRRVSRGIRAIISELPSYDAIITHAPASLRASLCLGSATWTSCRELYRLLCTPHCSTCGKFGAFLHIPSGQRVCYHCFTTEDAFRGVTLSTMEHCLNITAENLTELLTGYRTVRTLPGPSWEYDYRTSSREIYVDAATNEAFQEELHGTRRRREKFQGRLNFSEWNQSRDYFRKLEAWQSVPAERKKRSPKPRLPISLIWPYDNFYIFDDRELAAERRYGIVGFPWFNQETEIADWGVACNGCYLVARQGTSTMVEEQKIKERTLYSSDDFLWHLLTCTQAMKWIDSREDTNIRSLRGHKLHLSGSLSRMDRHSPDCLHFGYGKQICDVAGDAETRKDQARYNPYLGESWNVGKPCYKWHQLPESLDLVIKTDAV